MATFEQSVFINCPFDHPDYDPIFDAIVFAIHDCGYVPRCTKEIDDGGDQRAQKLYDLIKQSKFGIHDISFTELDRASNLPRFNMPYELGLFMGCREIGTKAQKQKRTLILDKENYRYQKFLSDISGQDPKAHEMKPEKAIKCVREWLNVSPDGKLTPGGQKIVNRYKEFTSVLPEMSNQFDIDHVNLTFIDYGELVYAWQNANPL